MSEPSRYERIYAVVRRIPRGRVATYGQVAELAGFPGHARLVGYALHRLPRGVRVPWQRVVNRAGRVSPRSEPEAEIRQRTLLEGEGVRFSAAGVIRLSRYGWLGPPDRRGLKRRDGEDQKGPCPGRRGETIMEQEKRKRTRVPVHLAVTVASGGEETEVTLVNVSLTGILCDASPRFRPGEACRVTISLSEAFRIVVEGKILRTDDRETAIHFTAMDEGSFAHLRRLVAYNAGDAGRIEEEIGTPAFDRPDRGGRPA